MKKFSKQPIIIIIFVFLGLYAVSLIFPMLWAVISSFKGRFDLLGNPFGMPKTWVYRNFKTAAEGIAMDVPYGASVRTVGIAGQMLNSVIYSAGSAFVNCFVLCLVAYLVAKYDFGFSKFVYGIVVVTMMIPIIGSLPSEMQIMTALRLKDSVFGVFVLRAGFTGMYFLIFYAQFKSVSDGYAQAASIDGASHTRIMFEIIFPLVRGTFGVVFLVLLVNFWNDYQTPMLYLTSNPTVSYGLYMLHAQPRDNSAGALPVKLAACILSCLPPIIIFIIFRNKMMGNFSAGGLKG